MGLVFLPIGIVARGEFFEHSFDAQTFGREEHDEVIEHVGTFVEHTVVRAVASFDDEFEGFFAHFLRYAVDSVAEEGGGVRAFGHFLLPLFDEVLEFGEKE